MKEQKIYQRKRYTANTPVARALSELIEQYGGCLVLEAVADYWFQHLGVRCFAADSVRLPSSYAVGSAPFLYLNPAERMGSLI